MPNTPIFPEQASTMAGKVDALYLFLVGMSAFFAVLVGVLVVYFAFKYRRRTADGVGESVHGSMWLEVTWTVIPLLLVLFIFGWAASLFFQMARPPLDSIDVYVVGKQWMWKFQHPDGRAEVNELHVPVGRNVRLTMTSQDVIHDVYIPAFRVKADVLPGKYTHMWFKATKPGRYHLFCAEYCGTNHSGMVGWIVAQDPADYQAWLAGTTGQAPSMVGAGEKLFNDLACSTCHKLDTTGRGPSLYGLFGKNVNLEDGGTVVADEAYLRESITNPRAKIVAGFQPLMPTFQGLVNEEGMLQLLEYIKSLKVTPSNATGTEAQAGAGSPASSLPTRPVAAPAKKK
jgi:cytochrome c oxidase subunit 2